MPQPTSYRLGVDIGGTFTDVVLLGSDGSVRTRKVASTPDDYARAIVEGARRLLDDHGVPRASVQAVVHATTVATNTILERSGARVGLVTTAGFRDVLEMRRLRIPVLYDLQYEKPPPLVRRRHVVEVEERLGPGGEVWRPLDEESLARAAEQLAGAELEAVAVSLLHAYANPEHERRVRAALEARLGPEVDISCSHEVLPELREYERTSTTVVNAYVMPVVRRYLGRLEARLEAAGLRAPLHIMQSSGGIMTAASAVACPARIIESGPAAGVIASARVARALGYDNVISFDMGGTTAKAATIEDGDPAKTNEYEVGAGINLSSRLVKGGGYPVKLPFIDISEIGAGGGSIVAVDDHGALKVGPQSAGAVPGPVCYGLGGEAATFSDAMVVLGVLNPHHLVGGELALDADAAHRALEAQVAKPLGLNTLDAAHGVLAVATAAMTRAVKAVTTYRGRDPRDFTLVAFGGNGPVAGTAIARALGIRRVLVPPAPGVFSALGLLFADTEHELRRAYLRDLAELAPAELEQDYRDLEAEALALLEREGSSMEQVTLGRSADMRYRGQAYELPVEITRDKPDVRTMAEAFEAEHERTYGHRSTGDPVNLVNIKVLAKAPAPGPKTYDVAAVIGTARTGTAERNVYYGPELGRRPTPVLARADLAERPREGPLIIEEYDATCLVPPGCQARLDRLGNIDILVGEP